MKIPVLIEPIVNNGFRATGGLPRSVEFQVKKPIEKSREHFTLA